MTAAARHTFMADPLPSNVVPMAYYQDQDQDQVFFESPPGPGSNESQPEMRRLEAAYRADRLAPVAVRLGKMPAHAGPIMHAIAEHMRLRMGLRRAVGDDRPLPYALSEAVRAGLARDKPTASKAIGALVRAGVIDYAGPLPPLKPGADGTKTYEPPAPAQASNSPSVEGTGGVSGLIESSSTVSGVGS